MTAFLTSDLGMLYAFHVHVVLSILALFGLILLYRWIVTTLPPRKQKTIAVWTLVLTGIGIAMTVPFCLAGLNLVRSLHS